MSDFETNSTGEAFVGDEQDSSIRAAFPQIIDGRYRVVGRVGAGAMGVVLRAEDLFLERPVAIKIVGESVDPHAQQRFVKEAQALAQVRHENVVQVYAFGPFQLAAYLAMELVDGEALETLIEKHIAEGTTMPLPRAVAILAAVARGLQAVHARHLIHRDVKPANIIIEKQTDRPVLIDFGLARRRSQSSPKLSITGGTPSYMAPEQANDPDGTRVTARTDLYAFACTAFELFTGKPVFDGDDVYSVLTSHMTKPPRKISSVRPDLAPIDDVLLRALAKEPADRQATVTELMAALEAAIARIGMPQAGAAAPVGPRTLVLAADAGLRRSLVRNTTQTMQAHGLTVACEVAISATEAASLIGSKSYDLIVLDEESATGRIAELVQLAHARGPAVELVVVSRDLPALTQQLGDARVRHMVPKPVNVHVLAAVLGRLSLVHRAGSSLSPSSRR